MLNPDQEPRISRRDLFKKTGEFAAPFFLPSSHSGPEFRFTVDEVLFEDELIRRLNEKILGNEPYYEDKLIHKSLLYHGMRYFGADHALAIKNSHKIAFEKAPYETCGQYAMACTASDGKSFKTVVNDFPDKDRDHQDDWYRSIYIMGHEAYHGSGVPADNSTTEENYGILGDVTDKGITYGFHSKFYFSTDLIIPLITRATSTVVYTIPEEFAAQVGNKRYFSHLLENGLAKTDNVDDFVNKPMSYPELSNGVFDYLQMFSGGSGPNTREEREFMRFLNPGDIDSLHKYGNRQGFLEAFGRVMMGVNPNINVSNANIGALGMVGFYDFANYKMNYRRHYYRLISGGIVDQDIVNTARELVSQVKAS